MAGIALHLCDSPHVEWYEFAPARKSWGVFESTEIADPAEEGQSCELVAGPRISVTAEAYENRLGMSIGATHIISYPMSGVFVYENAKGAPRAEVAPKGRCKGRVTGSLEVKPYASTVLLLEAEDARYAFQFVVVPKKRR